MLEVLVDVALVQHSLITILELQLNRNDIAFGTESIVRYDGIVTKQQIKS